MQDLFTYVYNMGHRKIAYIHGSDSATTRSRVSAFYMTAEKLGIEIPDQYVVEAPYRSARMTGIRTGELLELKNPPTCVLCPDDYSALGALNTLKEKNLRVGKDISIAGYGGIPLGKIITPQLTTINPETEKIGSIAGERLVALIEKPKTTLIEQILVETTLFEGGSVGRI